MKVYVTEPFLEDIIKNRKDEDAYQSLYKILYNLSEIYVDMSKDCLRERISANIIYKQLNNRGTIGNLHSAKDWPLKGIQFSPSSDLFLLEPEYRNSMSNDTSMIITHDLYGLKKVKRLVRQIRPFSLLTKNAIEESTLQNYDNSWSQIFNDIKLCPINAAVITDNYMFTERFEERKQQSLFSILHAIIPQNLAVDFHLSIFFNVHQGLFGKDKMENLISEIRESINYCSNMKIMIICHNNTALTHDRHICTNYHYAYSGKGFSVIDKSGVVETARGDIKCVYKDIDSCLGNENYKIHQEDTLRWLKKIKNTEKSVIAIAGDLEFTNRLFEFD